MVDKVNDLQVTRENTLQHGHWPSFQSLWEHRVIRVGEGFDGDVPGLVPREPLNVHKDPQQLRNSHGGVSIIQLNGHLQTDNQSGYVNMYHCKIWIYLLSAHIYLDACVLSVCKSDSNFQSEI